MCIKVGDIHPKFIRLRFPYLKAFATSPWLPLTAFIFYRAIVGLYCLSWIIISTSQSNSKWLLHVGNWVFLFVAVYFLLGTVLSLVYSCSEEAKYQQQMKTTRWGSEPYIEGFSGDDYLSRNPTIWSKEPKDELNFPYKVFWMLFTIASVGSVQITIIYWMFFYENTGLTGINISFLIFNSVFITIELIVSNVPILLMHFFYSHAFQSIYILFTVIYWAAGGTDERGRHYIYKAWNYSEEPGWAYVVVFLYLVVFQIFAHLYCLSLYNIRKWLIRKCY